ncbi:MAG: cation/cationic drug transporter [Bryobacterales bacterium]|nr:cation/cationic drug transporter [Bryobacterales bacterium]
MTTSTVQQKRRSLVLVIAFTVLAATAQVLIKFGTVRLNQNPSLIGLLTNFPLIGGLALYGVGSAMMVIALRHGELSFLYPLISLSYVWVAILSVVVFQEEMNPYKIAGIGVIIAGVAVMGNGARK